MSKQEISQEVLREIWIEYKEEIVEILQKKMENAVEKEKKTFEVEIPNLIGKFYLDGERNLISGYDRDFYKNAYLQGLIFDDIEEAKQYRKERLLLFKIKKWAEIQNDGWKPTADNLKFYIYHTRYDNEFQIVCNNYYNHFSKLPYFKSREIAQACINEFGDEILEVLC